MRLIRLLTDKGDLVLDPFLGSGTTAVAAVKTGRRFIGMELMPRYFELAKRNVERELAQPPLFPA